MHSLPFLYYFCVVLRFEVTNESLAAFLLRFTLLLSDGLVVRGTPLVLYLHPLNCRPTLDFCE